MKIGRCILCKKLYIENPRLKKKNQVYCSRKCAVRAWAIDHPERKRQMTYKHRAKLKLTPEGREQLREISNKWDRDNPAKLKFYSARVRAPNLQNELTNREYYQIVAGAGNKCQACGSPKHLCLDHIVPVEHGGRHHKSNLQILCRGCNMRKGRQATDYRFSQRALKYTLTELQIL